MSGQLYKFRAGNVVLRKLTCLRRLDCGSMYRNYVAGFLLVVMLLVLGCSGSEPDRIVFVSDRDGDPDIYIMNADGTDQIPLTDNGSIDGEPRISPDKKWVAFLSEESGDREINRMKLDDKNAVPERLTHSPGADEMHRWSPDSSRIAFVSNRDGQPEIYLMDAHGSNFTRVTRDPSKPHLSSWSPDSQWIAFTLIGAAVGTGIISRNPDGVDVRQLTTGTDLDAIWSPDGYKIVFTSERDGNLEIMTMNSDGSGQVRLTNNTSDDYQPSWSPDGKRLAFISERDGNAEIYVMSADGSSQNRLTNNDAKEEAPVWSPDGKMIAFVSYFYGPGEILVMDNDGNNQKRLTNNNANDTHPSW